MSDLVKTEERTIGMVTVEIQTLQRQAQQIVLGYAIEIGRRLTEAKGMLPHGEWGKWLENEVRYSKSTANNFMRIFEEYGNAQMGLFGPEANSQTLGSLPYTKALKLLAIPEEERESFAEAHRVDEISTRELDRLIKERDQAMEAKQEADRKKDAAEAVAAQTAQELETQRKALDAVSEKLRAAEIAAEEQKAKLEALAAKAERAEVSAAKAKEKAKKIAENPQVSEDEMARIRADAKADAEKAAAEKQEQKLGKIKAELEEAEKKAEQAAAAAESLRADKCALEKKLAMADADAIMFKAEFERLQNSFNACSGYLMKIEAANRDTAEKLRKAMRRVLEMILERV